MVLRNRHIPVQMRPDKETKSNWNHGKTTENPGTVRVFFPELGVPNVLF
jgi:hypothetical protein